MERIWRGELLLRFLTIRLFVSKKINKNWTIKTQNSNNAAARDVKLLMTALRRDEAS